MSKGRDARNIVLVVFYILVGVILFYSFCDASKYNIATKVIFIMMWPGLAIFYIISSCTSKDNTHIDPTSRDIVIASITMLFTFALVLYGLNICLRYSKVNNAT